MFEGPTSVAGSHVSYGGLSLIVPEGWVDHGDSVPQGELWRRSKDGSAGVRLWTNKLKDVIPTPGFDKEKCNYLTYMATVVIANGKLRWDEPAPGKVGANGVPAIIAHGVGPTGKDDWEVYCIRAKVEQNDVLAVVGWNVDKGAAFKDTIVGFVQSWQ